MIDFDQVDQVMAMMSDPELLTELQEFAADQPGAIDQFQAASKDTFRSLCMAGAASPSFRGEPRKNYDLRNMAICFLLLANCEPCEHLVEDFSRGTASTAFASPALGSVYCGDCAYRLGGDRELQRRLEQDHTCDMCGREESDGLLWPKMISYGIFLIMPFLCDSCSGEFGDPDEDSPTRHKVGRNDPCPCGSGTKFKKCCSAN